VHVFPDLYFLAIFLLVANNRDFQEWTASHLQSTYDASFLEGHGLLSDAHICMEIVFNLKIYK
jgi:hypothetical protein